MLNPLKPLFKSTFKSKYKSTFKSKYKSTLKSKYKSTLKSKCKSIFKTTNEKIKKHPILFASFFACIKNSVADYTIQKAQQIENKTQHTQINIKRNIIFALFGLIHVGAGQYIILNKIIPRIIPSLNKIPTPTHSTLKAIILDQFIHVPLIYFPLFYTFKEIGESTSTHPPSKINIINNYKSNFKDDMIISASIFMPIQYINFKYIPKYYRVPILSSCGFLYAMLLSHLRL